MSFRTSVLSKIARPRVNNYTPVQVVARVSEVEIPKAETAKEVVLPAVVSPVVNEIIANAKGKKTKKKVVVSPTSTGDEITVNKEELQKAIDKVMQDLNASRDNEVESSSGDEPEVVQDTQKAINNSLQADSGMNDDTTLMSWDAPLWNFIKAHDTLKNYKIVFDKDDPGTLQKWSYPLGKSVVVIKEPPKDGVISFYYVEKSPFESGYTIQPSNSSDFKIFENGVNEYNELVLEGKGLSGINEGSLYGQGSAKRFLNKIVPRTIIAMEGK